MLDKRQHQSKNLLKSRNKHQLQCQELLLGVFSSPKLILRDSKADEFYTVLWPSVRRHPSSFASTVTGVCWRLLLFVNLCTRTSSDFFSTAGRLMQYCWRLKVLAGAICVSVKLPR